MASAPNLPGPDLEAQLRKLSPPHAAYVLHRLDWLATARPEQVPPEPEAQADWLAKVNYERDEKTLRAFAKTPEVPWVEFGAQAGRGWGKTATGAEWLFQAAWEDPQALPRCVVAPTRYDARFTCFEGEGSGLLAIIPPACVENYNKSDLMLFLKNGAVIRGFSAEEPNRLRGPQHADAWCDEVAAWGPDGEDVWDMMEFGLRIGACPRILWSSTPKPNALIRRLTAPKEGRIIVRGRTMDNKANLAEAFLKKIMVYDGTKLGKQELDGELMDPEEAGIIKRSWLRLWPNDKPLPSFQWIIMSLDTAFTERTLDKKGDPDPTACGVWGVFQHEKRSNVMLLDCWEDHLGLPELARRVRKEMQNRYGDDEEDAMLKPLIGSSKPVGSGRKPDILLIEDKGSGISLRQTLAESGIETHAYNPGRADKLSRLHIVSPVFAQKRVWLPESKLMPGKPRNWCEPLIAQLCSYTGPGSVKHDDHIDQTTQSIRLMMDRQMLSIQVKTAEEKEAARYDEAEQLARNDGGYVNPYAA